MSNDVVFEGEDTSNNVGNIQIVPGAPVGMLAWLVKNKVVQSAKQAEFFLLGFAIVLIVLAVFFFVISVQHSVPKSSFVSGESTLAPHHP